jgi:hypothetical protein
MIQSAANARTVTALGGKCSTVFVAATRATTSSCIVWASSSCQRLCQ